MRVVKFPSFRADRTKVELPEVIAFIPDNELVWSILEIDAQEKLSGACRVIEFEIAQDSSDVGAMKWGEVKGFASTIFDTHFCLLVGARSEQDILYAHKRAKDFTYEEYRFCEVFVQAFDSHEWTIWTREPGLMQQMAAAYESKDGPSSDEDGSIACGGAMPVEDVEG